MDLKKMKAVLAKGYIPFAIIAAVGITLVIVLNLIYGPKELENWHPGKYADNACWSYGYYPVPYKNSLPKDIDVESYTLALNKYLKEKTGYGNWFVPGDRDGFYIHIVPTTDKELCAPIRLQEPKFIGNFALARSTVKTNSQGKVVKALIEVCVEKVRNAMKLPTKLGRQIKFAGFKRIIWHELVEHVIGMNKHPEWGCELMCPQGNMTTIHDRTLSLLKRIIANCKKNGRLQ